MIRQLFNIIASPEAKNRLFLVRTVVCAGLIAGILTSETLWINDRFFPLTPVTDLLPLLPPPYDNLLLILVLALSALLVFYPHKYLFGLFYLSSFYLVLQDLTRFQPWFYHYLALLGAVAWYESTPHRNNGRSALVICQTVLVGIYLWSGIHKINYVYLYDTFEWLIRPGLETFPALKSLPLPYLALASALIEAGAALLLLFRTTRVYAVGILAGMHLFILLMVGPGGLAYNSVIYPWNISFMLLLPILFLGTGIHIYRLQLFRPNSLYHGVITALFILMPLLNYWDLWDHYPSGSLYSGKKPHAVLNVSKSVRSAFPDRILREFDSAGRLNIRNWALAELNTPEYPQPRVYKHIFRELCTYEERDYALVLEIYHTADLITGRRSTDALFCTDVKKINP
ncbi:MAG: hypothetical protein R3224_08945 [Balneolaceae bacterium]|nr:hypothetical protein [Balneolaceae bacterium]